MRQAFAIAVTAALVAAALYFGRGVGAKDDSPARSPAECLEQMYLAAERGDVNAYLNCFTGTQRERLEKELQAASRESFGTAIAETVRTLKGRATNQLGEPSGESDRAQLEAERIYPQHNERQTYAFRREGDAWRIESLSAVERFQPPVKYGTPVYEAPPDVATGGEQ